jgi:hypothetical protein
MCENIGTLSAFPKIIKYVKDICIDSSTNTGDTGGLHRRTEKPLARHQPRYNMRVQFYAPS